jgi:outer membrane lipoprotein SlyB
MKNILFIIMLVFYLTGCTQNISPQTYSVGSIGQVNRTIAGTVVSAREVDISGTSSTGGATGGVAGAVAGSAASSDARGGMLGAIGGAIVGSIAGAAIESNATKQKGVEYVVDTENGNLMTIVQGSDPFFPSGSKILVLYGHPSRIISDTRR